MFRLSVNKCCRYKICYQQSLNFAKFQNPRNKPILNPKNKEERAAFIQQQRFDEIHKIITSALKQRKYLSVDEWKQLSSKFNTDSRNNIEMPLRKRICDVLLKLGPPNDPVKNAQNFFKAFDVQSDLGTKRIFLTLYAKKAFLEKLSEQENIEILEFCNDFIKDELHLLPEINATVTMGLCATDEWKKALELDKLTDISLNILIRKAIMENQMDLVKPLLNKLTKLKSSNKVLASKTILSFAKHFQKYPKTISEHAEMLLTCCERLKRVFDENSARELTYALHKCGYHSTVTQIDKSGVCGACNVSLSAVRLTSTEFHLVREEFLNNVVKGDDIYQKTTPEEWTRFEETIKKNGPFDLVVDGLNVAFCANPNNYHPGRPMNSDNKIKHPRADYQALERAVNQLSVNGRRILIIGRKHMTKSKHIRSIEEKATVFLVDNISQDDIFLLYAALASGEHTNIISNDFMRQHKFAIGKQFNHLFKLWQQEHWLGYTLRRDTLLDVFRPMQFQMHCHKVGNHWHVPFKSVQEIESNTWSDYEMPKHWACIRINSKN